MMSRVRTLFGSIALEITIKASSGYRDDKSSSFQVTLSWVLFLVSLTVLCRTP